MEWFFHFRARNHLRDEILPLHDAGIGFAALWSMDWHERLIEAYEQSLRRERRGLAIVGGISAAVLILAVTLTWMF